MAVYRAADSGTGFSVERWLKVVLLPHFTAAFRARGYVTYERCANLSEKDVRAVVDNHPYAWVLWDRIKELRRISEEDTAEILWVSTCHKCAVCMNEKNIIVGSFSGSLLYTSVLPVWSFSDRVAL